MTSKTHPSSEKKSKTSPSAADIASVLTGNDRIKLATVVKRNGAIVPFRKERIARALEAAFCDTKQISKGEEIPLDIRTSIEKTCDLITQELSSLSAKGASLTVEGIQDLVEVVLMKLGHHDVAKDYIIYRDQHKALREDSPKNLKVIREDGSIVR
ncbi:MAG: ribonucleoside-diphosphate reductase subunit alpha, partial [Simkania negevensis]|nr:ribonucleoside-diphosphate reductase subunit alpha [Simkania negevensis]